MNIRICVTVLAAIVLGNAAAAMADEPPICPPISLSLKNATLRETADALSKAAGVPVAVPDGADSGKRFTIDVKDKLFWEVFQSLSSQAPLRFTEITNGRVQLQTGNPGWVHFQSYGDMAVIPGEFRYRQTLSLQPRPPAAPNRGAQAMAQAADRPLFTLDLDFAFDPRLRVTRIIARRVLSVVDNAGNVLLQRQAGAVNRAVIPVLPAHYVDTGSFALNVPEHPGTRIATLDGDCIFEYMPASERFEAARLDSLAGKEFVKGDARVAIENVTNSGALLRMTGSARGGGILEICDADGRVVNTTAAVLPTNRAFSVNANIRMGTAPYKAVITVGATQEQSLRFHLTDLPLPLPHE